MEQLLNKDLTQTYRLSDYCDRTGIGYVTMQDSSYPPRLRAVQDGPLVLYYKGKLPDFEQRPMIGVVGTRNATKAGLQAAEKIGGEIAACGGIVVSGGALGIDICALKGAYAAGMPTVTVLAGGLDKIYPKENESTIQKLCETGCVLSEMAPGSQVFKASFLQRNRIISGMSNGILVVEAPAHSGALNTAHWGREQGKEIFAVPGQPANPECAGSNRLLDDGAIAASSGWAVMRVYAQRFSRTVSQREFVPAAPVYSAPKSKIDKKDIDNRPGPAYSVIQKPLPPLNEREQKLVDCLKSGPMLQDFLAVEAEMDTGEFMRLITVLAMKDVVDTDPDGMVYLK
jgi:DNA processing protein